MDSLKCLTEFILFYFDAFLTGIHSLCLGNLHNCRIINWHSWLAEAFKTDHESRLFSVICLFSFRFLCELSQTLYRYKLFWLGLGTVSKHRSRKLSMVPVTSSLFATCEWRILLGTLNRRRKVLERLCLYSLRQRWAALVICWLVCRLSRSFEVKLATRNSFHLSLFIASITFLCPHFNFKYS